MTVQSFGLSGRIVHCMAAAFSLLSTHRCRYGHRKEQNRPRMAVETAYICRFQADLPEGSWLVLLHFEVCDPGRAIACTGSSLVSEASTACLKVKSQHLLLQYLICLTPVCCLSAGTHQQKAQPAAEPASL